MRIVELIRLEEDFQYGTFGALRIDKEVFCATLEPPDTLNTPYKSCIPAQQYICERHISVKYGETFIVLNVPNRNLILFHPGNFVEDTEGCVILAQYWGKLRGNRAVLNSGMTFRTFMDIMQGEQRFHLTINQFY